MTSENTADAATATAPRHLAMVVAYEGAGYAGFQLQPNAPTIQGELEAALSRLAGEPVRVRGASRTDSGAHASGQVVDFFTHSAHRPDTFVAALNHYLPAAIRILAASPVPDDFHARRSAALRRYRYRILNRPVPSPLCRRTHYLEPAPLQLPAMRRAAAGLLGIRDFRQLATGHPAAQSAVRQVCQWTVQRHPAHPDVITIDCAANGFLRHQIRRVNAVLLEIGKGRLPAHALAEALAGRTPRPVPTLPAKGLCLQSVHYPDHNHLLKVVNYYETH